MTCQLQATLTSNTNKFQHHLTLLHSEWPKLHRVLAILSAKGLIKTSQSIIELLMDFETKEHKRKETKQENFCVASHVIFFYQKIKKVSQLLHDPFILLPK